MWNTPYGERTLKGFERQLVATESWALSDAISDAASLGGASVEVVLFDQLTWQQQMVMLERVLNALVDPTIPAPPTTALLEATVAAIFAQMVISVQMEIDLVETEDDPVHSYDPTSWFYVRQQILDSIREPLDVDEPEGDPFEEYCRSDVHHDRFHLPVFVGQYSPPQALDHHLPFLDFVAFHC